MALDPSAVLLLCCAKGMGVDFTDALMIGRQWVGSTDALILPLLDAGCPAAEVSRIQRQEFGEQVFRSLGSKKVASLDASRYQGATHITDLNVPCHCSLTQQFSMVFDGGTLEHVFNLPIAFKNCMDMVALGGHFVQITAANNFMGHGFWQISPEAVYRIFTPQNGFRVRVVLLTDGRDWYQVGDPADWGGRVELINSRATYLCTIATRVGIEPIFDAWPFQSDYVKVWENASGDRDTGGAMSHGSQGMRRLLPKPIKQIIKAGFRSLRPSDPFDKPYYRLLAPRDIVKGRVVEGWAPHSETN